MPGRRFTVAKVPPGTAPNVVVRTANTASVFKRGACVILTSNLIVTATAGAGATTVVGVAAQDNLTNPGNSLPFTSQLATGSPIGGRPSDVTVYLADRTNIFSGRMVNGGTDPVTPALTDIGTKYGVAVDGNLIWYVNQADTTNLSVIIVDEEPLGTTAVVPLVYFKFINASPLAN